MALLSFTPKTEFMSITNVRFASLFLGALLLPVAAVAKLNFPESTAQLKAKETDKTLVAKYRFTNAGPEAIDVLSLTSSCACTVPALEQKHYEPGESGTVVVTYDIGINEGHQSQTITIVTNEKTENSYALTFKADLPRVLRAGLPPAEPVSPRALYWTKRPFETKTVTVNFPEASKLAATCNRADDFQIETEDPAGKRQAQIKVTPKSSAGEVTGDLTVAIDTPAGKRTYRVFLRVVAEKKPIAP